jgi:hypothetical protein
MDGRTRRRIVLAATLLMLIQIFLSANVVLQSSGRDGNSTTDSRHELLTSVGVSWTEHDVNGGTNGTGENGTGENGTGENGTADNGTGGDGLNNSLGNISGVKVAKIGVTPRVANAFGGTTITLVTENITWSHRREITIFHNGSNLSDVVVNVTIPEIILNYSYEIVDDEATSYEHERLNNTTVRISIPTLAAGNSTLYIAYDDPDYITVEADLSAKQTAAVEVSVGEERPNILVYFGNTKGTNVKELDSSNLTVISPAMPYGNHTIVILLHNGSFYWTGDQLRHIPFFGPTQSDQTWTVPDSVDSVTLKLWGAGGGSGDVGDLTNSGPEGNGYYQSGGAGGFVSGDLNVTPGENLTLMVGEAGGVTAQNAPYSGGGWAGNGAVYSSSAIRSAGGGGGMSGVFIGNITPENATLIAGGGGGGGIVSQQYLDAGIRTNGGAAAWPAGAAGSGGENAPGASGANQTAGGAGASASRNTGGNGGQFVGGVSYLSGNDGYGGGAGGAGWFGGGGGGNFGPASQPGYTAGGGGGSSYYNATWIQNFTYQNGQNESGPANDSDYQSGIAEGSSNGMQPMPNGGAGRIVILYEPETSIRFWAIDLGLGNINDSPPIEGTDDNGIDGPPTLTAVAELVDSAIEFIMTDPESAAAATSASGGVALYVLFFRRSKGERKKMVSSIKGLGETAAFDARLRALKVLTGSRTLALIFGPLAWAWDELVFGLVEARLAVYGVSEVVTTEGLAQYLVFEVMGLSFTTPEALQELLPHIRNIATFLFVFFLYLTFFSRGSLYKEAKVFAADQTEEVEAAAADDARALDDAHRGERGDGDGDGDGGDGGDLEYDDGDHRYDDGQRQYDDSEYRSDEGYDDSNERRDEPRDERYDDRRDDRRDERYDDRRDEQNDGRIDQRPDERFDGRPEERFDQRPEERSNERFDGQSEGQSDQHYDERYDDRYEEDYDKPSGPRRPDKGQSDNGRYSDGGHGKERHGDVDERGESRGVIRENSRPNNLSEVGYDNRDGETISSRGPPTEEGYQNRGSTPSNEPEQKPEHDEFWHAERFSNLRDEVEAAESRPTASKADLFAKALDSAESSDSSNPTSSSNLADTDRPHSDDFVDEEY